MIIHNSNGITLRVSLLFIILLLEVLIHLRWLRIIVFKYLCVNLLQLLQHVPIEVLAMKTTLGSWPPPSPTLYFLHSLILYLDEGIEDCIEF